MQATTSQRSARTDADAKTQRGLTGWSVENIRSNIAKTIPKVYR